MQERRERQTVDPGPDYWDFAPTSGGVSGEQYPTERSDKLELDAARQRDARGSARGKQEGAEKR